MKWTRQKPTTPGHYLTRWPDGSNANKVIVTRKGKGLSVYCPVYNDRVPMSEVGDDELEWAIDILP
jgi:hypothetical protein